MKDRNESSVYLKPFVDFRQKPKSREPFYQRFTAWLTGSKPIDAETRAEIQAVIHLNRWRHL